MQMERWVKGLSTQNKCGVSEVNSDEAKSNTIGDNILLVWCHPSFIKPQHSYLTQNSVIYMMFLA